MPNINDTLCEAAKKGNIAGIEVALEQGANIDGRDESGSQDRKLRDTPLYYAVYYKHIEAAECLLKHGAQIYSAQQYTPDPIAIACIYGTAPTQAPMVALLLRYGANPYSNCSNNSSYAQSCLHYAVTHNYQDVVKLLTERGKIHYSMDYYQRMRTALVVPQTQMIEELREELTVTKKRVEHLEGQSEDIRRAPDIRMRTGLPAGARGIY